MTSLPKTKHVLCFSWLEIYKELVQLPSEGLAPFSSLPLSRTFLSEWTIWLAFKLSSRIDDAGISPPWNEQVIIRRDCSPDSTTAAGQGGIDGLNLSAEERPPSADEGAVEVGSPKTDPVGDSIRKNGDRSDLHHYHRKPRVNNSDSLSKREYVDGVAVSAEIGAPRYFLLLCITVLTE